ncbi:hypothetical protein JCM11641_000413 [Rhodosporidiobolus odoratus]
MLICLIGPPQSGKNSLADFLVSHHAFKHVTISSSPSSPRPSSSNPHLEFNSSSDFLDHATRYWRRDFVTTSLTNKTKLVEFAKRPFVAIIAVDAPLGVRFRRAVNSAEAAGVTPPSLEDFVAADDLLFHGALPLLTSRSISTDDTAQALSSLSVSRPPDAPTTPSKKRLSPRSATPPSPTPSPAKLTPTPSPELTRSSLTLPQALLVPPAPSDTLSTLLPLASMTLSNPFPTLAPFLSLLSLPSLSEHLRPSWDTYFMHLASLASLRSNCMKRRVGAVLVRDKRVVSTGYNGTPRGVRNCGEGGCGRCNSHGDGLGLEEDGEEGQVGNEVGGGGGGGQKGMNRVGEALDECLCLHAEENALLEAGRERVSGGGTAGAVLYCNTCPCLRCTVKIVQCGVREVIYSLSYSMDAASRRVMEEAGVVLRQIDGVPFPRGV